jgi:hypothetical protein
MPQNHVLQSQNLATASWSANSVTPTYGDSDPAGGVSASRLTETAAVDAHFVIQTVSTLVFGQRYTLSVYVKKGVGRDWIILGGDTGNSIAWFNIVDGYVGTIAGVGAATVTGAVDDVGGGWFRCSLSWLAGAGALSRAVVIYMASANGVATYAGSTSNYILYWGAQVTDTSTPAPYVATTTIANLGRTRGRVPKQNLIPHSNLQTPAAFTVTSATLTANTADVRDPVEASTAAKLTEAAATAQHRFYIATGKSMTGGTVMTTSVYVKAGVRTWAYLTINDGAITWFNLATGIIGTNNVTAGFTVISYGMESVGGGWYRCWMTITTTAAGLLNASYGFTTSDGITQGVGDGSGTMYFWRPQVTESSGPAESVSTGVAHVDEGAPRGRMPRQNLILQTSDMTVGATWSTAGGASVAAGSDGWFDVTDDSAVGFEYISQTVTGLTIGRIYTFQFLIKKTSGGTAPTFGVNGMLSAQLRLNTDTGANNQSEHATQVFGVRDRGDCWLVTITGAATTASMNLQVYPAVGLYNAAPTVANQSVAGVGTARVKNISLHEALGPAEYVSTTTAVVNEGAPRGEVPQQNLVTYSQEFASGWSPSNVTITSNIATAPDGTMTADAMVASATGAAFRQVNAIPSVASLIYNFSIYVKAGTKSWICIATGGGASFQHFNIATGVLGSNSGTQLANGKIEDAGNGWYRCSASSTSGFMQVFADDSDGVIVSNATAGDILYYLWGGQVTLSTLPAPYAVSGAAVVNQGTPRGQMPRQNHVLYSTAFASWNANGAVTVADNAALAPDGTMTATRITDTAANTIHYVANSMLSTSAQGKVVTFSFYGKAGTGPQGSEGIIAGNDAVVYGFINYATGVMSGLAAGVLSYGSQPVGDGWYRYWLTYVQDGTRSYRIYIGNTIYAGVGSIIYLWRPQLTETNGPADFAPTTTPALNEGAPRGL